MMVSDVEAEAATKTYWDGNPIIMVQGATARRGLYCVFAGTVMQVFGTILALF